MHTGYNSKLHVQVRLDTSDWQINRVDGTSGRRSRPPGASGAVKEGHEGSCVVTVSSALLTNQGQFWGSVCACGGGTGERGEVQFCG